RPSGRGGRKPAEIASRKRRTLVKPVPVDIASQRAGAASLSAIRASPGSDRAYSIGWRLSPGPRLRAAAKFIGATGTRGRTRWLADGPRVRRTVIAPLQDLNPKHRKQPHAQ